MCSLRSDIASGNNASMCWMTPSHVAGEMDRASPSPQELVG